MIKLRSLVFGAAITLIAGLSFIGGSIDTGVKGLITFQQAEASPYRRSVRRTARRTSRRTARRNSYYY